MNNIFEKLSQNLCKDLSDFKRNVKSNVLNDFKIKFDGCFDTTTSNQIKSFLVRLFKKFKQNDINITICVYNSKKAKSYYNKEDNTINYYIPNDKNIDIYSFFGIKSAITSYFIYKGLDKKLIETTFNSIFYDNNICMVL